MRRHTIWLRDRLRTIPGLSNKVFVTVVPKDTPLPFVVIHPQDGEDDTDRLTGPNVRLNPRFTILTVHRDADAAARLAEDIKDTLVVAGFGVVPEIEGEWPERVWYNVPAPLQVDKDSDPWTVFHTAECGLATQTL